MRQKTKSIFSWIGHGIDGELMQLAASLAYTTLLSLVPLFTVVLSILSAFPVFEQWTLTLEHFIFANFVPASGELVSSYLRDFSNQAGRLTAIGLATLLVTALLLLSNIENALNRIWGVRAGRSAGQRILVYWALLSLGPIMIVASLTITSYLISNSLTDSIPIGGSVVEKLVSALPFVLELASFSGMYYLVPNHPTRFLHSLVGALIATVLFEGAKIGFTWYLTRFNSFEVIYGALGVIPIFLIWIYISWLVILIGARYAASLDVVAKSDAVG
jgi:membrane protein